MAEQTQDAEQLVKAYRDLWNDQAYSKIPDLVSESYTGEFPEADEAVRGPDALEEFMREFSAGFPDFHVELRDLVTSGETVVAEGTYTMTHEGEFDGIPPTGREVELQAMAKFHVEDGKVKKHREYHDRHALLEQLGIAE